MPRDWNAQQNSGKILQPAYFPNVKILIPFQAEMEFIDVIL